MEAMTQNERLLTMFARNNTVRSMKRLGQFEDQAENTETVLEVPEDLTKLSDSEVQALLTQATEGFADLFGDGSAEFSNDELESLEGLTDAIETLRGEGNKRQEAAQERTQKAADFAVRVNGETVSEDDVTDLDITTETPGEDEEAEDAEDTAASDSEELSTETKTEETSVTASAARKARRVNLAGIKSRQRPVKREESTEMKIEDVLVASANVPGKEPGAGLNWLSAADIVENRLKSFNKSSFDAAARAGRHIRQQMSIATVRRNYSAEATVSDDSPDSVDRAMAFATDESRLPGGSLVASGGWCAPSETIYDFMETETRDGLFSIPEINVARGGIRYSNGADFTDLFANLAEATWDVSEAEDIEGDYQNLGSESDKPCLKIDCPDFVEERLRLAGLCLSAGLLQQRGYPEHIARTLRGTLVAHDHVTSGKILKAIRDGSDPVVMPAGQVGATSPVLTALELQAQHYRTVARMSVNASLEAVFPTWVKGLIRADLGRRTGVDMLAVSDAQIAAWFTNLNLNPQFVYNFSDLAGESTDLTAYPEEVPVLMYAAGTWVRGAQDVITLDTVYDSNTLRQNDYTALFTEEGYLVAKRGHDSRYIRIPVCANGSTNIGEAIACDGTSDPGL